MKTYRHIIIGGGLAGLYAAYRLVQRGEDFVLLEATAQLGGRVQAIDGLDLGGTWFWAEMQPELDALVRELNLPRFEQYSAGDMVVERSRAEPPMRVRGFYSAPVSYRLVGGMITLIDALAARVPSEHIRLSQPVAALSRENGVTRVQTRNGDIYQAENVLLALPPRLAAQLNYAPALPDKLRQAWEKTSTWMAAHAKYLAVYDRPFWREDGLSGAAFSQQGALGEIHDISLPNGKAALFGFFAVPASARKNAGEAALKQLSRLQLARLFGETAATPEYDVIQDWSQQPFTATAADQVAQPHQSDAPPSRAASGEWADNLQGIASEWSPSFSGYLAGAEEAVRLALA